MTELDSGSHVYLDRTPDRDVDAFLVAAIADRVVEDLHGETVIELGVGDRVWTPRLLARFDRVISVDGSAQLIAAMGQDVDQSRWMGVVSMFEEFTPPERVATVVATWVLEHVDDPAVILRRSRSWLHDDGELIVVVPNVGSLHRQLACAMGLVDDPTTLGDTDRRLGHKRVFAVDTLVPMVEAAGYAVERVEGYLAKALPNSLLVHCSDEQLRGLVDVGRQLPIELSAAIHVRARARVTGTVEPVVEPVPFLDLDQQHRMLRAELVDAITTVFDQSAFAGGVAVDEFERRWAEFCDVPHAVGLSNGTDALEVALRARDLPRDSGVVVPSNSFIATAEAVVRSGLRPVFCDVRADTLLVDAGCVERVLDDDVSCVVPVHLYGQMAAVQEIVELAEHNGLAVIEDAAQAHGATRDGINPGQLTAAASFSFYPGKNLGALGDAGAVVTRHRDLADRMRAIRNHGGTQRYEHTEFGFNARMDGFQAAVLSVKLAHLRRWNDERRRAAARYLELLKDIGDVEPLTVPPGSEPVWHLFVVRVANRDELMQRLLDAGIGVGIHYPTPIHLCPPFRAYAEPGRFPVVERAASQLLSLPLFPGITDDQIESVVAVMRDHWS